jgi:hypothetical protein
MPIERILRLPVHEEHFIVGDDVTALPDRQRVTVAVMLARFAYPDIVDRDVEVVSTSHLPRKRKHTLQHRYVAGQIIRLREECRERFGRQDRDKVSDSKSAGGA